MRKKQLLIIFLVILVVVLLVFTVKYSYALLMLDNSATHYKNEWNNPYINANYSGWKLFCFSDGSSAYIPDTWSVSREDDQYIFSQDNEIIAWCGCIGTDTSTYSSRNDFLQDVLGFVPTSSRCLHIPDNFTVYQATYNGYEYTDGIHVSEYLVLQIWETTESGIVFVFPSKDQVSRYIDADIAEAIIYSYYEA